VNPQLVYCSITGFGQTGPYAPRAGYDFLMQGMGGLMSLTGRADGADGEGPLKVGVALTDIMTGLYATVAIQAALAHRERTGKGQHIDLALLDVQIACLANQAASYLIGGVVPKRMGNAHPSIVPYQDFPTADGYMIIAVGNDGQFAKCCAALGRPDWASDERFARNPQRVKHRDELIALIRGVTVGRTTGEWIAIMEAAGVPCGPVNSIDKVFEDAHVQSREMRIEMEHPLSANVSLVANPIRLSESPVQYRHAPPMLGAHTEEVLDAWLDMSGAEIEALRRRGII
jgi:crotonobetainyl-CoA:carnitine CoA-transferase CaiB-like acyl-CoA transferase